MQLKRHNSGVLLAGPWTSMIQYPFGLVLYLLFVDADAVGCCVAVVAARGAVCGPAQCTEHRAQNTQNTDSVQLQVTDTQVQCREPLPTREVIQSTIDCRDGTAVEPAGQRWLWASVPACRGLECA